MKALLAILCGLVMTFVSYAAGVLTAIFFLIPQPEARPPLQDAGGIWTSEPVRVRTPSQNRDLRPARPMPQLSIEAQADEEPGEPDLFETAEQPFEIDMTTTASIADLAEVQPEPEPAPAPMSNLNPAHVQWCFERYRSYRPEDNSYTSYSGGVRECVSPYSGGAAGSEAPAQASAEPAQHAMAGASQSVGYLTPEHIQSCFARYRSYRPEDNSYQPYDGGPRRQCR